MWKRVVHRLPAPGRGVATFLLRIAGKGLGMDPMFDMPEPSRRVPAWRLILIMGLSLVALLILAL